MPNHDEKYVSVFMKPLLTCANYRPAFGRSGNSGTTLDEFEQIYGSDPFYHWVGLDSELMYAAHKAAGGMTSIYRQLGVGCERLFRAVAADNLALTKDQLDWKYEIKRGDGTVNQITLDARLDVRHVVDREAQGRLRNWVHESARKLEIPEETITALRGAVFEVRQGYKSADSKRQNADLRSGIKALADNYLFVVTVHSAQINDTVRRRY